MRKPKNPYFNPVDEVSSTARAGLLNVDLENLEYDMLSKSVEIDGRLWLPANYPPVERKLVMVTGASGIVAGSVRKDRFLTLAYHDPGFRPPVGGEMRWLGVDNENLMDNGWRVEFWTMPIGLPGRPA